MLVQGERLLGQIKDTTQHLEEMLQEVYNAKASAVGPRPVSERRLLTYSCDSSTQTLLLRPHILY